MPEEALSAGAARALELLIAPVVIIPACGLLVMSISARLNAVIARIRAMHSERIDVHLKADVSDPRWALVRAMRSEGLDHQSRKMIQRCKSMRLALRLLYATIALLALDSLVLGVGVFVPALQIVAVAIFAVGMVMLFIASVVTFREMGLALEAVGFEHDRVITLCDEIQQIDKAEYEHAEG